MYGVPLWNNQLAGLVLVFLFNVTLCCNAQNIQQSIDTSGNFQVPLGTTTLSLPVFIDQSGITLSGPGKLEISQARSAFYIGWRRGMISDDHYTPLGFRTLGDSHLILSGTRADLGPNCLWSSVQNRLKLRFSGIRNTGTVWKQPLFGIQGAEVNPVTGQIYHPLPTPFVMYTDGSYLVVGIRLTDNVVRMFRTPLDLAPTELDVTVTVDLSTKTLSLGSTVMTPWYDPKDFPQTPWPDTPRLIDNTQYPLGITRMPPTPNASGYWMAEGARTDTTIRTIEIWTDDKILGKLYPTDPRPVSYPGAPSLPLVPFLNGWALAVHQSQGTPDSIGNVKLHNFSMTGAVGSAICLGAIQNKTLLSELTVDGGNMFRTVHSTQLGVTYPIEIIGLSTQYNVDTSIFLTRSYRCVIDRCVLDGRRCGADLIGCTGKMMNTFIRPDNRHTCEVFQRGGDMTFDRVLGNFEWDPAPKCIRIQPLGVEGQWYPTKSRIFDCSAGRDNTIYEVLPIPPLYTGPVVTIVH